MALFCLLFYLAVWIRELLFEKLGEDKPIIVVLQLIFVAFYPFAAFILYKSNETTFWVAICRLIVLAPIVLIPIRLVGYIISQMNKLKEEEEQARLELEQKEIRARRAREEAEDRARRERKKAEKRARLERKKAEERARREREEAEERARLEREKAEERARREREKAEERARLEREKEIRIRTRREKIPALKRELIESGLFYEDDPWDILYNEELTRLELERARLQQEREYIIKAKREKVPALKTELIESGLFYEDDPWDILYNEELTKLELVRARLQQEREYIIKAKREKVPALKTELIESGLFYEDDPWDKLYNDNGSDG